MASVETKLRPLGDRVVVRPVEREEVTSSGIVLPDTAREKPQRGVVIAVGPGRWNEDGDERIPVEVSDQDEVLFAKYAGTEVKVGEDELLIISEKDILAVVGE